MIPAVARPLLERAAELAALTAAAGAAAQGRDPSRWVAGRRASASLSVVAALRARLPAGLRMLAGYCDD